MIFSSIFIYFIRLFSYSNVFFSCVLASRATFSGFSNVEAMALFTRHFFSSFFGSLFGIFRSCCFPFYLFYLEFVLCYETEFIVYTAQSLCNLMLHMGHISMKYFCHILRVVFECSRLALSLFLRLEHCSGGKKEGRRREKREKKTPNKNLRKKRFHSHFSMHFMSTIYLKSARAISTEDITTFWINCKRERKVFYVSLVMWVLY